MKSFLIPALLTVLYGCGLQDAVHQMFSRQTLADIARDTQCPDRSAIRAWQRCYVQLHVEQRAGSAAWRVDAGELAVGPRDGPGRDSEVALPHRDLGRLQDPLGDQCGSRPGGVHRHPASGQVGDQFWGAQSGGDVLSGRDAGFDRLQIIGIEGISVVALYKCTRR